MDENEIEPENSDAEEIERDKLLFDLITDTYNSEKARNNNIDEKASKIILFVGILISLQSAFGTLILKEFQKSLFYYDYVIILGIGLIFFIVSILCGLNAYRIVSWKVVPKTTTMIKYGKEEKYDRRSILRIISKERSNAVEENKKKIKSKVQSIKLGFLFFLLGIIVTVIFITAALVLR